MELYQRPFEFMRGYTDTKNRKYMNLGLGTSPYPGKIGHGDYGPRQGEDLYYKHAVILKTFQPEPNTSLNVCSSPLKTNFIKPAMQSNKNGQCSSCE